MKKAIRFVSITLVLFLAACATTGNHETPGAVSTFTSGVDSTTEVRVNPAWVNVVDKSKLMLGLVKTSNANPDQVVLIVAIYGIEGIQKKDALTLKLDNETVVLSSIDDITDTRIQPWALSQKRFITDTSTIKKIANSKTAYMRLYLINDTFLETQFKDDGDYSVRPAFKKAVAQYFTK